RRLLAIELGIKFNLLLLAIFRQMLSTACSHFLKFVMRMPNAVIASGDDFMYTTGAQEEQR
ncbi:MAG: hypothetical protein QXP63_06675, partial [Conexivisphaerales archaeon]